MSETSMADYEVVNKYLRVLGYQIKRDTYERNTNMWDQVSVEMLRNAVKITRAQWDAGKLNDPQNRESKHSRHSYLCGVLWKMIKGDMPVNPEDELEAVDKVDIDEIEK